jgi:hypothetical protein
LNAAIEISLAWQDAKGQWLISKSKLARLRAGETVIIFILRVPQKRSINFVNVVFHLYCELSL